MDQQENNIITLTDEEGNEVQFEHLMTVEYKGSYYILLEAANDMDDAMEGEALILKILQDEQGEDYYATVEDEDELQAVFDKCVAAMEEQDAAEAMALDMAAEDENEDE